MQRICEELVSAKSQANIFSPIDSQIGGISILQTNISNLIDINIQKESLFTLDNSDYEEVTEIKPESDDNEETIIDYFAPDIESSNKEIFEDFENFEDFS
ncbi:10333_t:CDS:2 [Dentiscutata heterogama]|uniref:10333_t:CDS:1 n=1 Tax=Dentiscutata heterogama TaxID=1316150 RepID=A0ACA9K743_9GLOM|nr:10333_t:CDS:2 [Dentiscutata heterogama]